MMMYKHHISLAENWQSVVVLKQEDFLIVVLSGFRVRNRGRRIADILLNCDMCRTINV